MRKDKWKVLSALKALKLVVEGLHSSFAASKQVDFTERIPEKTALNITAHIDLQQTRQNITICKKHPTIFAKSRILLGIRTYSAILNARSSDAQYIPAFAVLLAYQLGRFRGIGEGQLGGIP
jgi:hypothetical protein